MNQLKLHVWGCELFSSPKWRLTLSALAEDQDHAKNLILGSITDKAIREEVIRFFANLGNQPGIYDTPQAFVYSQGTPLI